MPKTTELRINGRRVRVEAEQDHSLLSVLRDELDLTGTKYGCGEGQCGACTVLVDGKATRSCITALGTLEGKSIRTVEGLSANGKLHPVQEAFLEAEALQCGYCTPGMVMSAVALLETNKHPDRQTIVQAMNGNMCRCGTYARIVTAVASAAGRMR